MSLLSILYKLFIGPLELFFEVIYAIAYRLLGDPVISILVLSLAMNFLVLPLYRRADAMQEEERDRTLAMKPWTDHIKKTFKGDERFMMLQAYNRQNGYKQTDIFKSSISLLLEIPFFIAAYHFLSNLKLIHGASLGPIPDLGAPDALLQLGGLSINILPIVMTLINIVSAAIYLKGFPLSSKIQTYGIAAIFLILLYNSPAGLVFYWTLNNIFSLIKNIFYKLKNPKAVLSVLASITGLALPIAFFISGMEPSPLRIVSLLLFFVGLQLPIMQLAAKRPLAIRSKIPQASKEDSKTFLFACLFLALLTGLLIPLSVIQSSPSEFIDVTNYQSPLLYVTNTLALALGTFVIWFGVFYWIATPTGKTIFLFLVIVLAIVAIVSYLFFGTHYGNISPDLLFDHEPTDTPIEVLLSSLAAILIAAIVFVGWNKKKSIPRIAFTSLCVAIIAFSVYSAASINKEVSNIDLVSNEELAANNSSKASINLSKQGKNVVVIMLDRAVPGFIPFFIEEKPQLKKMLSGFTCYSNTLSYGPITNVATPALYGGSEYRPKQINEQSERPLSEKHNEALKVMPTIFAQNEFEVTVFDPTYAGYGWIPDLSIYDNIENVKAYRTSQIISLNMQLESEEQSGKGNDQRARNLFCYSLFKIAPLAFRPSIYQQGAYNSTELASQIIYSPHKASGVNTLFMQPYTVLDNMADITEISPNATNHFFVMANDTTHEPTLLEEPSYTPNTVVDNTEYDAAHSIRRTITGETLSFEEEKEGGLVNLITSYHANMAAMLKIGEWCEYLKENDVYDNTRIILVSDHSWGGFFGYDMVFDIFSPYNNETVSRDARVFNCLLMVKDFGSTEFRFDDTFMTNADTPVLAFKDIVEKPTNPYTGNIISSDYKNEKEQYVMYSTEWSVQENNGNTFNPGQWFSVHDDVRDINNWTYLYEE